jgi:lipopolysaccharide export system permease protein
LSIIVKGVEEDRLLQPVISVQSRGQTPAVTLVAQEACLRNDRRAGMLHIECVRGQIDVAGKGSFKFPDRFSHRMQLQEPEVDPENHLSPANLAGRQILPQIARERKLIAELQSRLENEPESDERSAWERERDRRAARLHRLSAEVPRRMSNGFGCFCFALVGIPVAMRNRSSDVMSVFFLCFLPVLLVYYPLLVVGENMARDGTLPYVSVWMADAVLVVAGILLLRRSMRN